MDMSERIGCKIDWAQLEWIVQNTSDENEQLNGLCLFSLDPCTLKLFNLIN